MTSDYLQFTGSTFGECAQLLFSEDGAERFAFAVARPVRRGERIAFLVEQVLPAAEAAYATSAPHGVHLTRNASSAFNWISLKLAERGLVPVHFHSHPTGMSQFSGYDDQTESELHGWLSDHGQPYLLSVVWPYGGEPTGRIWAEGKPVPLPVRDRLRHVPGHHDPLADGSRSPALDRQRAFGNGLRQAARTIRLAVIGTGGIGMLVVEQLARAGFEDFLLVDHDRVEDTNFNRLPGALATDAGRLKVDIAKRLILQSGRSIGTQPRVRRRAQDVYIAGSRLRREIGECDLILAVTDSHLSRIVCLELALASGAEYLQAGTDVRLDGEGRIEGLMAEMVGAEAGRFCPVCVGRLDPAEASIEARRYVGGEVWRRAIDEGYVLGVPAPSVMSLNAVAAGILVLEIQRRVSGIGARDLLQANLNTGEVKAVERYPKTVPECEICA